MILPSWVLFIFPFQGLKVVINSSLQVTGLPLSSIVIGLLSLIIQTGILKITGLMNNVFKALKVQQSTRIRICNTWAVPHHLIGSETWTTEAIVKSRITAAEMKFMNDHKIFMVRLSRHVRSTKLICSGKNFVSTERTSVPCWNAERQPS